MYRVLCENLLDQRAWYLQRGQLASYQNFPGKISETNLYFLNIRTETEKRDLLIILVSQLLR